VDSFTLYRLYSKVNCLKYPLDRRQVGFGAGLDVKEGKERVNCRE
jgi:hypothetical protein